VTLRGLTSIETIKSGGAGKTQRECIVISSIPFQTNKAALCEQIADLVNARAVEGVADVRDESDRDGMRVVIELRRARTRSSCVSSCTPARSSKRASR
jgi:DNA gyrase subunit A